MAETITSLKNEGIKALMALRDRKGRNASGQTVIDGVREIKAALSAGVTVEKIYVCPELLTAGELEALTKASAAIDILETTRAVAEKMAFGDRAEGAVAVAKPKIQSVAALSLRKNPLVVVLEQVEKPGNLGAILRTCDAAGVDAVVVCDPRTDVFNPNVIRASLGAVFTVPVAVGTNQQAKDFLVKNKIKAVATFPDAETRYDSHRFQTASAIVLGSEQAGLSSFWGEQADVKIQIPMQGQVNSLNVAACAAIVIYEAIRQRS